MLASLSLCALCIIPASLGMDWTNEFDTYNVEECGRRVRRNWNTLTETEQELYIRGVMELRARGFNGLNSNLTDEYHRVAAVHRSGYGGVVHMTSHFFFWHSYVLWEMESRIRSLGGEWACFAMPYWDFWTSSRKYEAEHGYMFQKSMGGDGDPDNSYTVTEDWPWTTEQFWVPYHCIAEGDVAPLCSFKRNIGNWTQLNWPETGRMFTENPNLIAMQQKFVYYQGKTSQVTAMILDDDVLQIPATASYDPFWYLFHSMISYQQYMWQDCNEYDQIDPDDLDENFDAYSELYPKYMNMLTELGVAPDMSLDAPLYFIDTLQNAEWAYANQSALTVRKLYHLHRWNVIYDLGDGSGFYEESGFKDYCGDNLNAEWFTIEDDHLGANPEVEHDEVSEFTSGHVVRSQKTWTAQIAVGAMVFMVLLIWSRCAFSAFSQRKTLSESVSGDGDSMYGAIKPLAV